MSFEKYVLVKLYFNYLLLINLFVILLYRNLPPNQGGRYSGFGNTIEQPPRSQSQDLLDSAVSSFSSVRKINKII